ncbi:MAG: MotA/TolQ/ExbB proton channel family protein [Deltaproteobacteria bacterium]|nr:MotA/TolQ/ExbB proton channel family protein [Nannocystaceae bacterium]
MDLTQKFLQFALVGAEWVLWLLVALSVISVYIMLERFLFFRQLSGQDAGLRRNLLAAIDDGDIPRARKLASASPGTGARIVTEMLDNESRGPAAVEAALNGARSEEKLRLERNLSFLGTLGANAPFIGLFGTVLGIIRAFKDLADSGLKAGGESSEAVMAGISEALVATAVGLLVAIPAVVAYNIYQRKVKRTMGEAEALAQSALGIIVAHKRAPRETEA